MAATSFTLMCQATASPVKNPRAGVVPSATPPHPYPDASVCIVWAGGLGHIGRPWPSRPKDAQNRRSRIDWCDNLQSAFKSPPDKSS